MNCYCWKTDSQTAENWHVLSVHTMKVLEDTPLMNMVMGLDSLVLRSVMEF